VCEPVDYYKNIYENHYCKQPVLTFDNISVFFKSESFEHAFYESANRKAKDKTIFSYPRANRIYWIKWVLQNPNALLFKGYDHNTKSYDKNRRIAVCVDDYVVVIQLGRNPSKATFITAYVADGTNGKGEKAIDLILGGEKW
jgi:hypothetical protein